MEEEKEKKKVYPLKGKTKPFAAIGKESKKAVGKKRAQNREKGNAFPEHLRGTLKESFKGEWRKKRIPGKGGITIEQWCARGVVSLTYQKTKSRRQTQSWTVRGAKNALGPKINAFIKGIDCLI